jgi:hypothetical protein
MEDLSRRPAGEEISKVRLIPTNDEVARFIIKPFLETGLTVLKRTIGAVRARGTASTATGSVGVRYSR